MVHTEMDCIALASFTRAQSESGSVTTWQCKLYKLFSSLSGPFLFAQYIGDIRVMIQLVPNGTCQFFRFSKNFGNNQRSSVSYQLRCLPMGAGDALSFRPPSKGWFTSEETPRTIGRGRLPVRHDRLWWYDAK